MRLTSSIRQGIGLAALLTIVTCNSDPARKLDVVTGVAGSAGGFDSGSSNNGGAGTTGAAGSNVQDASAPSGEAGAGATGPAGSGGAPPSSDAAADAITPMDVANPADASLPAEAGNPTDSSIYADAGKPADAGQPTDAPAAVDVLSPIDVGLPVDGGPLVERIGFGSCNDLTRPQTFWPRIVDRQPQAFLFLGDNAYLDYGDTYEKLGALPGFKSLMAIARPFAIWDDHDYGTNDGGGAFGGKESYKKKFIDFWGPLGAVPAGSPRRTRPGNYDSVILGPVGRQVQVLMLDARYFKGAAPSGTVLGDAQWQWLSDELRRPANIRIIMSGFQALGSSTTSEGWGEYPAEQQRLMDLIKTTQAKGVVIVSGDKHYAEISRRDGAVGYPLYDFTSSSLTASNSYAPEANAYRDMPASASQNHNFGLMTIDWATPGRPFTVQIIDAGTGAVLMTKSLSLAALGSS